MNKVVFKNTLGFTLVELLVSLVVFSVVGTGIMSLYVNSSKTYETQTLVGETQQNVRAAIESITFDLRNAGYNPTGATIAGLGFVQAGTNVLQVTMDLSDGTGADGYLDINSDGVIDSLDRRKPDGDLIDSDDLDGDGNATEPDPNENVTYSRYDSGTNDIYGNPISRLGRNAGSNSPVAEYIQEVGFAYAFDSDDDGSLDVDVGGRIHWAIQDPGGGGTWFELDANSDDLITAADDTDSNGTINAVDTGVAVDLNDIRAVKIWVLGTSSRRERNYTSTQSYVVGNQVFTPNDAYRHYMLTTSVACRNMGL